MDQILLYGGLIGAILFGLVSILLFWKLNILYSIKVIFRLGNKSSPKINTNKKQSHTLQIRDGKTTLQLQNDQVTQPLTQESNTVLLESSNLVIFDEGYVCEGERIIL